MYSGRMRSSVHCSSHLAVRWIVHSLDDLTVDSGHRKDLLAVACHKLVDVHIVAELERLLIDRIPFDDDVRLLPLKTFQVLIKPNETFIDRRATQPGCTTHGWFKELDFQRNLLEDSYETVLLACAGFPRALPRPTQCNRLFSRANTTGERRSICQTNSVVGKLGVNLVREKRYKLEGLGRQVLANGVQRPVAALGGRQEPRLQKNAEMIRDGRLRQIQGNFQLTNTQSAHTQNTDNTRPRSVTQRSRNRNHVHHSHTSRLHRYSPIVSLSTDIIYVGAPMCQEPPPSFFLQRRLTEEKGTLDVGDAESVTLRYGSISVTVSQQQGTFPAWKGKGYWHPYPFVANQNDCCSVRAMISSCRPLVRSQK